jgi:MFS transporter, SP family, galactose:H+ symporter
MVSSSKYIYFIACVAGLGGILFGFDTGVVSGAIMFISRDFSLTNFQEGAVVSIVMFGAIFGTLVSNFISRNLGRHFALIVAGLLFTICAIGSAFSGSLSMLIGMRLFLGVAIGIASYVTPLYLAEVSPCEIRGKIISFYQLMIAAGLLLAYISDTCFTASGNWRYMLGIPAIPGIILFLLSLYLPGSPRWLMLKGRHEQAREVLLKILPKGRVDAEIKAIAARLHDDDMSEGGTISNRRDSRKIFRMHKLIVKVMILGILLQMMQQWTGCNIVLYYAPIIFKLAGFSSPLQQMWGTIAVGIVMTLTTIITIKYVDNWGRRPILFIGLALMLCALLILGISVRYPQVYAMQVISIIVVLIYILGFAISLGPIVWILCSEIFPIYVRDFGVTTTTAANWIFNAALALIFPSLLAYFGSNAFFIFASFCILSFALVKYFVPETKDVSLETIEANLFKGNKLRNIGIKVD